MKKRKVLNLRSLVDQTNETVAVNEVANEVSLRNTDKDTIVKAWADFVENELAENHALILISIKDGEDIEKISVEYDGTGENKSVFFKKEKDLELAAKDYNGTIVKYFLSKTN